MIEEKTRVPNLRTQLMAVRDQHGADSEVGGRISNFLEMWENHRSEPDRFAKQRLEANMAREVRAIEGLLKTAPGTTQPAR